MIARLVVKDAKGKKHELELLCTEDDTEETLLARASASLDAWEATKSTGPYALAKCEVVDA